MVNAMIKLCGMQQWTEASVYPENNTVEQNGKRIHSSKLALDTPVTGMVYGTLLNYKGVLEALGNAVNEPPYNAPPIGPVLYIKPANTHIGYGSAIPLPADAEQAAIGAALGVVIGRTATRVSESEALDYVAGYTIVNDVQIPHQQLFRPAIRHLSRDGFCPAGPWVMKPEAIGDPHNLKIRVYVNGVLKQEQTTARLIRTIPRLLAEVTDFMTLNAGDMLHVGIPENAPLAAAGDVVRIAIDGIGCLDNPVVREQGRAEGGEAI